MRPSHKTLLFPLSGVSRREGYREQSRPPFAAPWAVNVRGVDALEERDRGGTRPGLAKVSSTDFGAITALATVTSVDADGNRVYSLVVISDGELRCLRTSALLDEAGGYVLTEDSRRIFVSVVQADSGDAPLLDDNAVSILTEDGDEIVFASDVPAESAISETGAYSTAESNGQLYIAGSELNVFDPITTIVQDVVASEGTVPTSQPVVCVYRDRVFLAGEDHVWYASRQGDHTDWAFGADMEDSGRAVAGELSLAGLIGETPMALIPINDEMLVFACENSLWVLNGDPASGTLVKISSEIGVVGPEAWAVSHDGLLIFLSNDGVYTWSGGKPERYSEERTPNELRNVDGVVNYVSMAFDSNGPGFHLFITPVESGDGSHWWIDIRNQALWPVVFGSSGHQPVATSKLKRGGLRDVVIGCSDGYLRRFSSSASTDDSTAIQSHVLIGPIRLSNNDLLDSMLGEVSGMLAQDSGDVTWRAVVSDSAEEVCATAKAGITSVLASETPTGVNSSGTWVAGRNKVSRPRNRGTWCVLWLSSVSQWAYEAAVVLVKRLGRAR